LDAEVILECQLPGATGRVGVCHDRVLLAADDSRLEHAASLLAPLLVPDLATVLWLPEPGSPIPDQRLLARAQQVVVDSGTEDGDALGRLADLVRWARVHDLAWGRLDFWRAATASAFEPPERRTLLARITRLDVAHGPDAFSAALLLAGWITARAGWLPQAVERHDGRAVGRAERGDGGRVAISLTRDPHAGGCGGVEGLVLGTDSGEVRVARGAATSGLRDLFAEALQPRPSFARGYADAVQAAVAMLKGGSGS
jgi:glucose-6-phosphate dehydrogenase assembly protein OpcA